MNFKSEIKWKSHKGGSKWNWKCDTDEGDVVGGTDENRIRLHRPGSHRLLEMGNRFKAGTVCWQVWWFFFFLPSLLLFFFFFSSTSYTFNQTHVKTCLHVMKGSGTCSNRVSHRRKNLDDLTVGVSSTFLPVSWNKPRGCHQPALNRPSPRVRIPAERGARWFPGCVVAPPFPPANQKWAACLSVSSHVSKF